MGTPNLSTQGTRNPGVASWRATDPQPLKVPVITEAEKRLSQGQYARAVADAYHRVVLDVQKAYGLTLPAQWTHREFLSDFLREDMGVLTTRVERLYRMYEPVRYGTEGDWTKGDLIDLLLQIYDEPPMRDLYRPPPRPPNGRPLLPGTPASPSTIDSSLPPRTG
jgi:hypothetical protein